MNLQVLKIPTCSFFCICRKLYTEFIICYNILWENQTIRKVRGSGEIPPSWHYMIDKWIGWKQQRKKRDVFPIFKTLALRYFQEAGIDACFVFNLSRFQLWRCDWIVVMPGYYVPLILGSRWSRWIKASIQRLPHSFHSCAKKTSQG